MENHIHLLFLNKGHETSEAGMKLEREIMSNKDFNTLTNLGLEIMGSVLILKFRAPGIQLISKELIQIDIQPWSIDLKVKELGNGSFHYKIPRLANKIIAEESSFRIEPGTIILSLKTANDEHWPSLHYLHPEVHRNYWLKVEEYITELDSPRMIKANLIAMRVITLHLSGYCWRLFQGKNIYALDYEKTLDERIDRLKLKVSQRLDFETNFEMLAHALLVKECKGYKLVQEELVTENIQPKDQPKISPKKRLAGDLKNEGNAYFKSKKFKEAIGAYSKAIELDPDCAIYYLNRALAFYYVDNINSSKWNALMAIKQDPFYAKAYLQLSKCYLNVGDLHSALLCIHRAKDLDPLSINIENEHEKLESFLRNFFLYIESLENNIKVEEEHYKQELLKILPLKSIFSKILICFLIEKENFALVKEEAQKLITIPSSCVEGFIYLSLYYFTEEDENGLNETFEKVYENSNCFHKSQILLIYKRYEPIFELKKKGNKSYANQQFSEAIKWYLKVLKEPVSWFIKSKIILKIGCSKFKLNKINEAIVNFTEAINGKIEYHEAFSWRGKCYLKQDEFSKALKDFEKANAIKPSKYYENMIKIANKDGKTKEAVSINRDVNSSVNSIEGKELSLQKELANCKKEKGNNYYKHGQYEQAIKSYSEAIELDGQNAVFYSNRSACYLALKQFNDAMKDSEHTLKLDSKYFKGLFRLGKSYIALGKASKALQCLEEALKLSSTDKSLLSEIDRAKCLQNAIETGMKEFENECYETSERYLSEASLIGEGCLEVHLKKLRCLLFQNKFNELLSSATFVHTLFPNNSEIYYFFGVVYFYKGERIQAVEYLEKYQSLNSCSDDERHFLEMAKSVHELKDEGDEAYNKNHMKEALLHYTEAREMVPTQTQLYSLINFNIGLVSIGMNELENAIHAFTSAIDSQSNFDAAYLRRAECYVKCNMISKAVKDYEHVNSVSPSEEHEKLLLDTKEKLRCMSDLLSENDLEFALCKLKSVKGENLLKEGNYEDAAKIYSDAIHFNSESAQNYANRSFCYIELKDFDKAFDDAKASVQLDSKCLKGVICLARCYIAYGDATQSGETFEEARKLDVNNGDIINGLSKSLELKTLLNEAQRALKDKAFKKAYERLECASKIACASTSLLLNKAECLIALERLKDVTKLIGSIPPNLKDSSEILCIKGLYSYHKDKREEAIKHLKKATEVGKENVKVRGIFEKVQSIYDLKQKGDDSFLRGNWSQAIKFYWEASGKATDNKSLRIKLLFNIGINEIKLNNNSAAINSFTRVLELRKDYVKALEKRAECYKKNRELGNALKDYKELYRYTKLDKYLKLSEEIEKEIKKATVKDHYNTLQVPKDASMQQIRKAYKRLAKKFHPDKIENEVERAEGEEKFKKISTAYSVLSDPLKRERYDKGEEENYDFPGFDPFFASRFESLLQRMFVNRFSRAQNFYPY